ncbi:MAG: hypothetical protein L3J00_07400 [Thiomicrorhabdus sp.]|nr:hypothetical protein [Thiomicrorhabdus sp.]
MSKFFKWMSLISLLLLVGCPAPSDRSKEGGSGGAIESGINLFMSIASTGVGSIAIPTNDKARVDIVFLDENNAPIVSELINLSVTSGVLSQSSILTDGLGKASVVINPPNITEGTAPGVFTATPQSTGLGVSFNYQFVAVGAAKPRVILTMSVESTGVVGNNIPISDVAKIDIAFVDSDNSPLANELINLSTTSGSLTQTSVLTDVFGRASVLVEPPNITIGTAPGVFTATPQLTGEAETFNYQFIAAEAVKPQLTLVMSIESTGVVDSDIPISDVAKVDLVFVDAANAPLVNELINLSATSGTISQTSVLTDNLGAASVLISPPNITQGTAPGVFTATPELTSEAEAFNYQFIAAEAVKPQLTLVMTISSTGVEANSIPIDDAAKVELTFLDSDNSPLANELITLSSTSGALSQLTVLTDPLGVASVTINPPGITTGTAPGVFTATPQLTSESETFNYQFVATVLPESAASLQFISADPTFLSLKGTGGVGYSENSRLTYKVVDDLGNPVSGVEVQFTLTTTVGGLTLTEDTTISNEQGEAFVTVLAGTVPTPVRVTAFVEKDDGTLLSVQSDVLTVTTGIPDQNSFSLGVVEGKFAPEGGLNGDEVVLVVHLGDRNNNPIPDGTVINFTAEGGVIDGSCATTNGTCEVTWRNQNPKPLDNRATILAYAIGHETFYDHNGDGVFNDGDLFDDLGEIFRDDDESGAYNPGAISFSLDEKLIDYDESGDYTAGDGVYNGIPCDHSTDCPTEPNNIADRPTTLVNIGARTLLIMASSSPNVHLYELLPSVGSCLDDNNKLAVDFDYNPTDPNSVPEPWALCQRVTKVPTGEVGSKNLWVLIEDTVALCLDGKDGNRIEGVVNPSDPACIYPIRQSAPTGSSISVSGGEALSISTTPTTVGGRLAAYEFTFLVLVTALPNEEGVVDGTLEVVVTTPQTNIPTTEAVSLVEE